LVEDIQEDIRVVREAINWFPPTEANTAKGRQVEDVVGPKGRQDLARLVLVEKIEAPKRAPNVPEPIDRERRLGAAHAEYVSFRAAVFKKLQEMPADEARKTCDEEPAHD
jgi:hypothetical protein